MQPGTSLGDGAFVLVYFVLALLSFWTAYREARHPSLRPYCYIWAVIGVLLLLLCVQSANRELNLVTNAFRQQAYHQQWYGSRRTVQEQLVHLLELVILPLLGLGIWLFRRAWVRYLPACTALSALLLYGGVQAISLHRIDTWMHAHHMGLLGRTWCQIACVVLVAAALLWSRLRDKHEPGSNETSGRDSQTRKRDARQSDVTSTKRDTVWKLYSFHGWMLAVTLFASAHAFVVGWVWLVPAVGASIANLLVWTFRTRGVASPARLNRTSLTALIPLLPILYLAVQSLVWRREVHLPLTDPLVQLAVYTITLFTASVLCAGSFEWRPLVAPLAIAGVLCGIEGLGQLLLQVHTLHDLKTALPFAGGLNDNSADLVRIRLPLGYWNYTAAWLMSSMALALGLSASYSGKSKRNWLAAAALLIVCILFTASRWGSFCTLIVLVVFACRRSPVLRVAAAGAVLAIVVFVVNQGIAAPGRYTGQSHSLKYRTFRWAKAVAAVREHPWTGEGPARQFPITGRLIAPDGLYFALLRVGGWIALSQFAVVVAFLIIMAIRLLRSTTPAPTREVLFGTFLGLSGMLVGWCLETMMDAPPFVLYLLVLLGMLLGLQSRVARIPAAAGTDPAPDSRSNASMPNVDIAERRLDWDGGQYRSGGRTRTAGAQDDENTRKSMSLRYVRTLLAKAARRLHRA